mgnify:CR=1 FL=1
MKNDSKIWGIAAAILGMVLLFLFLWFYYLDAPFVPEEEGIEVALGDYVEGGADTYEPSEMPPEVVTPTPPAPAAPSSNDMMVQDDDESLALQKQAEEERRRKAAEEAERLKQQQEEQARLEAERLAKEQAAAEKAAKEQAAKDKAQNLMAGKFGNTGTTSGSGNTSGESQQGSTSGNPASAGNGKGPKVSLAGRNLRGNLAMPGYNTNDEGIVVVSIRVNAAGKVIEAKKGQGTNTSNEALINAAINAAKQATFSPAESADAPDVFGTITYDFTTK